MLAILSVTMDAPASFEFAKETVTQLIGLATGVIGISVTFAKEVRSRVTNGERKLLFRSWSVLLASIVFGVWTLCALTGTLAGLSAMSGSADGGAGAIYELQVSIPSVLQIISFLVGIGMLIRHATK